MRFGNGARVNHHIMRLKECHTLQFLQPLNLLKSPPNNLRSVFLTAHGLTTTGFLDDCLFDAVLSLSFQNSEISSLRGAACRLSAFEIGLCQAVLGMLLEVLRNSIGATNRNGKKVESLLESFIGFSTTEPKKTTSRIAKTFASQTGDTKLVIGSFEQI